MPIKTGWADTFYVAPNGNDSNPGTLMRPFASLERARDAVRKTKGLRKSPTTVFLRGGIYYLKAPVIFSPEDSGTAKAPVIYRAYGREKPVLSGASKLNLQWSPYKSGIFKARVPEGTTIDQLFVAGKRQNMARYPNFDPNVETFNGYAPDAISKERVARWSDPTGGYIHTLHSSRWASQHYRITGKNADGDVTYEGGWQNNRPSGMHKTFRFVENIFEELDAPGEWFLDARSHTLYFYPPTGLNLATASIENPQLSNLIEFRGSEAQPTRFITLQGLTLSHTLRTCMDNKEPLLRSDWTVHRGGAIFYEGSEDCALLDSTIDQIGGNAVFVNNYNRRLTVRGCYITEAGTSAIAFVGDPNAIRSPLFNYSKVQNLENIDRTPGPKTNNYPADCLVENCLLTRTGRVEKQSAPIEIDMAQGITVRHCSIYDVPRAGINIGDGAWGGHIIEGCDVFDTVKETGDHGSFNSWGRDRFWRPSISQVNDWVTEVPELPFLDVVKPIILRNNRWRCDHGWDIDLDDGSSRYEIYNNLCLSGGIKNREGYGRLVENNIMVNNTFHPHVWYAKSGDIFRRNIVFTPYKPIGVNKPWGQEIDFNLKHVKGQTNTDPATGLQDQSGRDEHSLEGDALFVNAEKGDFRVKDGSPALALGFQNFAMNQFGVQKPELKAMARTPMLGALRPTENEPARDATIVNWMGARVRNIVGQGEMSAYGLPGEKGVLILESTPALNEFNVLKEDVILALNGQPTETAAQLLRLTQALRAGESVKITVSRLQQQSTKTIRVDATMLAKP